MKKRLTRLLALIAVLIPLLTQMPLRSGAATRHTGTRAIGIVFDNSGSMYGASNSAWCRATYAMEVFASMMNEGDRLLIYPMWPITLGQYAPVEPLPLVIEGPGEADIIRQIYTPVTGGTPFATVTQAYEGLLAEDADEKYLIILTDGAFDNSKDPSPSLDSYAKDMDVMFLAIGGGVPVPQVSDPSRQYYDRANDSAQVLSKLTVLCNRIFGRDELEVRDGQISFDVSMSKMIVFIQGQDVSDVRLSGGTPVSSHGMRYSDLGRGSGPFLTDWSLQGMIATYSDLDAGTYQLSWEGRADSIKVYYEPDVDLQIRLLDEGGSPVDPSSDLWAGQYQLSYTLVDKYGDPTSSALLGDICYDLVLETGSQTFTHQDTQSGTLPLELKAGDRLRGTFTVRYLDDYTSSITGDMLGWPAEGLDVVLRPLGELTLRVEGGAPEYPLTALEQEAVYDITVFHDGEQIRDCRLIPEVTGGNAIAEVEPTGSGFRVRLRYNGSAADTQCGDQELSFRVFCNEQLSDTVHRIPFTVTDDSTPLEVALRLEQSYYVISQLESGSPITVELTTGGAPLGPEHFRAVELDLEAEGLSFRLEADESGSRYLAYPSDDGAEPGIRDLRCTATGPDSIGRPGTAQAQARIECQHYPRWLRAVFWAGLAVLAAALIWAYMNTKVLPRKICAGTASFIVNGKVVPGKIAVKYSGGGKKRGTLSISSPKYAADPAMKCGLRLELVADSPRRIRSSQRRVKVVSIAPGSKLNTTKMRIGGTTMVRNTAGQFVKLGTKDDTKVGCSIGNNTRVGINALILSPVKGRKLAVSLNDLPLKFY